jgi:hypothetical protein
VDYLIYKESPPNSKATQEQVDKLIREVKKAGGVKTVSPILNEELILRNIDINGY